MTTPQKTATTNHDPLTTEIQGQLSRIVPLEEVLKQRDAELRELRQRLQVADAKLAYRSRDYGSTQPQPLQGLNMNARDHIREAAMLLRLEASSTQTDRQLAMSHALLSIACTLADMADMDADTRTQPAVKPPAPAPNYQLYHPGDTERIPT